MMGLLRSRGVGLSVLAGGPMTSYQWLVRMTVSTAMVRRQSSLILMLSHCH